MSTTAEDITQIWKC